MEEAEETEEAEEEVCSPTPYGTEDVLHLVARRGEESRILRVEGEKGKEEEEGEEEEEDSRPFLGELSLIVHFLHYSRTRLQTGRVSTVPAKGVKRASALFLGDKVAVEEGQKTGHHPDGPVESGSEEEEEKKAEKAQYGSASEVFPLHSPFVDLDVRVQE